MKKSVIKKSNNPAELLQTWLTEHGLSQAWLSRCIGRPQKTISEIMSRKTSVTAKTAIELEKATSIKAVYWLQLQNKLDLKEIGIKEKSL